jgi:general secretion pathway protein E
MKVEPFLIASTLRAVIAQRLVRRLCAECREPVRASGSLAASLGLAPGTNVFEPKGCPACGGSGYKGRIGLFEAVRVTDEIRRLVNAGADEAAIAALAFRNGDNLAVAARVLVEAGTTSPEEAVRVSRREADNA